MSEFETGNVNIDLQSSTASDVCGENPYGFRRRLRALREASLRQAKAAVCATSLVVGTASLAAHPVQPPTPVVETTTSNDRENTAGSIHQLISARTLRVVAETWARQAVNARGALMQQIATIFELVSSQPTWAGEAVEAPTADVANKALQVVTALHASGLRPDRIVASGEGGIAICFIDGSVYADIECLNCGDILASAQVRGSSTSHVWEVALEDLPATIGRIGGFLRTHGHLAV